MPADAWQHLLRITEGCVGCGICERVCPSFSIHMADGKVVHIPGNCQTCLACAHACPQKAIRLTIPEVNPAARYRNEHISLGEIMEANCQLSQESEVVKWTMKWKRKENLLFIWWRRKYSAKYWPGMCRYCSKFFSDGIKIFPKESILAFGTWCGSSIF